MAQRRLDFVDHQRRFKDNRYVYPVVSRRSRGLSIGVNLNPDKVCNFDCPYCQVDRTVPGRWKRVDLEVLEQELDHMLGLCASRALWSLPLFSTVDPALRRVNDVAFAGDGEPCTCPQMPAAVELVARLRSAHGLEEVKPIVLSNATLFHRPAVMAALDRVNELGGETWAKLDAGTEPYFQFVDGTTFPFARILDNLLLAARRWPLVIQSMFLRFNGLGADEAELDAWAARLADILAAGGRIAQVQVYSVARVPARPSIDYLPDPELERIAERARRLGLNATTWSGRPTSPSATP